MRLLLINNATNNLSGLQTLCAKHELAVVQAGTEAVADWQDYDAVILSGSYDQTGTVEADSFASEIEIIQDGSVPTLGICFGFALICYAYDAELALLGELEKGAEKITPTDDGAKIFQGSDPIRVAASRRWSFDELPKSLSVLARSDNGIEAIRHKTKPIYGLQLQLEDFNYVSDGKLVFENILSMMVKQKA